MYTLKKSLGQHFLHDENICRKIVELLTISDGMNLVEIGPGGGAITKYLLQIPGITFRAIEVDDEKVVYLNKTYPEINGKIIHKDVLKADAPYNDQFSLIGNFPYNISSPILFKILDWEPQVQQVVGMFQKEVAQRVAAGPGSKTYGILSVLMQAFYKVEYMFDVSEKAFTPPPKVLSGVLKCTSLHNPHNITDQRKFRILVKAAFGQRRKTLRNALKSVMPPAALADPIMGQRAEQLSVADFVDLYNKYMVNGPTA